ncbi:STAS domain-containing protein [Actinoplanes sp. NEAU-A12]|uniref:Anti-sigma factor antagonist n=1 Tax=Actinoplanes sandaracinus TaxID=3045177 RepID=A0ABT6WLA4_9ACTN|nr:STAS domain-containing protein [Actinoplanes sandaracinus]MDI6100430.1 STAS domain-containing protein [Actinoplanes sandaracinus]
MDIKQSRSDDILVLKLIGDLDGRTAPAAQAQILEVLPSDERVLLDLSELGVVTSAGLRTMLLVYRQAQARNSTVGLVGLSQELHGILSATGFLTFFVVSDTVDDGLSELADVPAQRSGVR